MAYHGYTYYIVNHMTTLTALHCRGSWSGSSTSWERHSRLSCVAARSPSYIHDQAFSSHKGRSNATPAVSLALPPHQSPLLPHARCHVLQAVIPPSEVGVSHFYQDIEKKGVGNDDDTHTRAHREQLCHVDFVQADQAVKVGSCRVVGRIWS